MFEFSLKFGSTLGTGKVGHGTVYLCDICKFHLGTAVGQGDLRSVLGEGEFKLNQNLNVNRLNENS